MIAPFGDKNISGTDTLYYSYRKKDNLITKYCALIGGDDPIALYLGFNDRYCYFTKKWTGISHNEKDKGDYLEVTFEKNKIPAVGANGFFFRKKYFDEVQNEPFIHQEFVLGLINKNHNKFAKVKQGIIHVQPKSMKLFFLKKIRRIKTRQERKINFEYKYNLDREKIIKTAFYILSIILPLRDTIIGFYRKPHISWIFHPIATFGLFLIYIFYSIPIMKRKSIEINRN